MNIYIIGSASKQPALLPPFFKLKGHSLFQGVTPRYNYKVHPQLINQQIFWLLARLLAIDYQVKLIA